MAEIINPDFHYQAVNLGEERLIRFLEQNLPANYYLIPNIEIGSTNPRNNKTQYWEYDVIVVSPHAIYCIENKDWSGRLEGDDNIWYINDRQKANPLKVLRQKTAILHSKLEEQKRAWNKVWVQGVVTLSHPYQTKDGLWQEASKLTFLLNNALISFLMDHYKVGKTKDEIKHLQEGLVVYITGQRSKKKPKERKEVQGYEITEVLDQDANYTEYLAKPKGVTSSIRKRVKEYTLRVAGLNDGELAVYKEKLLNQYKALNKIKAKPFILNVEFKIDDENNLFYEISDYLDENSLRAELKRKDFTIDEKIGIIKNIIAALKEAHKENIFHRDINPDNIFILSGYALLGNFGKAYFIDHDKMGYTVMPTITKEMASPYHAQELLARDASQASDIYSLGVLTYELFVGKVPISNPFELDNAGGKLTKEKLPCETNPLLPKWLDEYCNKTIRSDEDDRFKSIEEVEQYLNEALNAPDSEPVSKPKQRDKQEIEIGDTIGSYTIYRFLGQGGYSKVYQVMHTLQGKLYAMKLFNESVNQLSVKDEYDALKELNHPNVVKFIWNDIAPNGQYYTLMEYLEGENLRNYMKDDLSLPSNKLYQLAIEMLNALVEMQSKNPPIYHRDIKPQNIIWENRNKFVLIDFNVATTVETNRDFVGTNPYLAPDLITDTMKVNWDKSADSFALGISLYELTCKNHPWKNKRPLLNKLPTPPQEYNHLLSDEFSNWLLKSIETKGEQRFKDAKEMLIELEKIGVDGILSEKKSENSSIQPLTTENQNQVIVYINSLYSQSKYGNAGTRAQSTVSDLDSFTFIETKLDRHLLSSILDGNYKLVIITGNAGDGKTSFIKSIENRADALINLIHRNGSNFKIKEVSYESNYDGSQDQDEKANNQVLEEFFKPFENVNNLCDSSEGRIIAINEGRLMEFLQTSKKHRKLADALDGYFYTEGHSDLPDGLLIANLNYRSVVASSNGSESIFRQQIKKLTHHSLWSKCDKCEHSSYCFIKFNVQSFNDSSTGKEIINRMEWLLRIVSFKRELHITIRDLRSFIAFLLTRDYKCDELPGLLRNFENEPEKYWGLFYFNITAPNDDSGNNDRLIRSMRETDIAESSCPQEDRDLFFNNHEEQNYLSFETREFNPTELFNKYKNDRQVYNPLEDSSNKIREVHKIYIRHQYYEGKADFTKRLPYKSVLGFYDILKSKNDEINSAELNKARLNISKAVSINEGCNNPCIYEKSLVLNSSQVSDPISKSFRLFPLSDFELIVHKTEHLVRYLEYEPDSMIFRHKSEKAISLTVSLDLFEMLKYIENGYSPSLNDLRGKYIELQIFKNMLENLAYEEVVVTQDNIKYFKIRQTNLGNLELSPLEVE